METRRIIDHLIYWLKSYNDKAKTNGFVVGVSGGIDSAVVSTLCSKTGLTTFAVNMPIGQAQDTIQRSRSISHIEWLKNNFKENVNGMEYNLLPMFNAFKDIFPGATQLAQANTKSRLRMIMLYAIANDNNVLVTGTGNKVEDFGVGFFTKYGDGGVDIGPIGGLLKTQVRKVGRELGILQEIIDATPTDGLWEDGRTDEEQLGMSYEEMEWAMNFYGSTFELNEIERKILSQYDQLHNKNKHKIEPIPVPDIPDIYF